MDKTKKLLVLVAVTLLVLSAILSCAPTPAPTTTPTSAPTSAPTTAATPTSKPTQTASPAPAIKLRYSTGSPATDVDVVLTKWWIDEVNKRTGGRVTTQVYSDAQLFKHAQTPDAVITGAVEMGSNAFAEEWPAKNPLFEVTTLWFLLNSIDKFKTAAPAMSPVLYAQLEKLGVKPLNYFYHGGSGIISKPPIKKPADMKGLTIRAPTQGAWASLQAYGAKAAQIPTEEAYDAFAKGALDGIVTIFTTIWSRKWYEPGKYLIGPFYFGPFFLYMNAKTWNSLPKDIQDVVLKVSAETEERSYQFSLDADQKAMDNLKKYVELHVLTPPEVKDWLVPLQPIYADWLQRCEKAGTGAQAKQLFDLLSK